MTICLAESARRGLLIALLVLSYGVRVGADAFDCPPLSRGDYLAPPVSKFGRGLVWRVTAPSGASSVVLGTMHVADPRVDAMLDVVRGELDSSRQFVMEVVLDAAALGDLQMAMRLPAGSTLRDIVGDGLFELTAARLSQYGIARDQALVMKPWAAFTALSMPAHSRGLPLDMNLMLHAQAAGKSVSGLETVSEQIAVFESLAIAAQLDMLREVSCHHDVLQAEIETLVTRYDARDLAGIMALSMQHVDAADEAFLEVLLWERNVRMVARMTDLLDAGDAFIAVGALHLVGPRGILERLDKLGYSVGRIY